MTTPASTDTATATADDRAQVTILLDGKTATIAAQPGETILDSARRGREVGRASCGAGVWVSGVAVSFEGTATMRVNDARDDDEVDEGYVLTCQGVPDCSVVVDYDC